MYPADTQVRTGCLSPLCKSHAQADIIKRVQLQRFSVLTQSALFMPDLRRAAPQADDA